jgi:hypothetical protein
VNIHSFDGVLRHSRTMHSFAIPFTDKRIPLPRPVPYISMGYFVVVELFFLVFDNVFSFVPLMAAVFSTLSGGDATLASYVVCYVVVPGMIVWFSMNAEIDGRAPHLWLISCARYVTREKHTLCGRRARREGQKVSYKSKVNIWWDLDAPRLHHGYVNGGRLRTSVPVRFGHSLIHRNFVMRPSERGQFSDYEIDGRLEVKP